MNLVQFKSKLKGNMTLSRCNYKFLNKIVVHYDNIDYAITPRLSNEQYKMFMVVLNDYLKKKV
jgi:hypothetical protein